MRTFITYRTATKLVRRKGLTTVAGFFAYLTNAPAAAIPKPVGDLILVSHGNDLGWMQIDLIGGGATTTDWAELTKIKNTPALAAKLKLSEAVYSNADGTLADITVVIKGCRIGQSERFVQRLMEVFGGAVKVSAPKHMHMAYVESSYGAFEHLAYGFAISRSQPISGKTEMLTEFKSEGFTYVGGNGVPDARWDEWIPASGLGKTKQVFDFPVALGQSIESTNPAKPVTPLSSITPAREFRHLKQKYGYTIEGVANNPADDVARLAKLRSAVESDPTFDPADEYPVPQRYGFPDVGAFLDGFDWSYTFRPKHQELVCTGLRHVYMVVVPLTDPGTDPDPTTGPLLFNFYPKPGKPFAASEPLSQASGAVFYGDLFFTAVP